jgi:ABC-type lipoprotein export system ATPase subunit
MIMVTHDKDLAQWVPRRLEIIDGHLVWDEYRLELPQPVRRASVESEI